MSTQRLSIDLEASLPLTGYISAFLYGVEREKLHNPHTNKKERNGGKDGSKRARPKEEKDSRGESSAMGTITLPFIPKPALLLSWQNSDAIGLLPKTFLRLGSARSERGGGAAISTRKR